MASDTPYTLAGVMGWPVAHSRSPAIHGHWIRQYNLRGAYVLLPVQPERLVDAVRGLGALGGSGLVLADAYAAQDAERRFGAVGEDAEPDGPCIAGAILRGERKPPDCPAFGTRCTPASPLGVTMVSAEGACAAYHRNGRAAAA